MELFLKKKYQYYTEVKIDKQVDHNYPIRLRFKLKNKVRKATEDTEKASRSRIPCSLCLLLLHAGKFSEYTFIWAG